MCGGFYDKYIERCYISLQVCNEGTVIAELEHPVKGSDAWQWVEKTLSDIETDELEIKLALKSYEPTPRKRQLMNNGSAFFDDISVISQSKISYLVKIGCF